MDLVDFPTEEEDEGRKQEEKTDSQVNKGLKMSEGEDGTSSSTTTVEEEEEEEEKQSDQSLYSRIWTYFGSNSKPSAYI